MRKNYSRITIIAYIFLGWLLLTTVAVAAPSRDPVSLLQYIADGMISGLKANKATLKSKPSVVYGLAYTYVVPNADLSEMSRRVLPPRIWRAASEAQRKDFQKLFTTTVIRTYASALSNYKDQSVIIFPVRGSTAENNIKVRSQIVSSQRSPIDVSYSLIRVNGQWKLYDMAVEGVSMLSSFREQFAAILSRGDMNTLLTRLSGHNGRS